MRSFFLLPASVLFCFSLFPSQQELADRRQILSVDTVKIKHQLDGLTTEWPNQQFETDHETGISYTADNDPEFLFVALRIPNEWTQVKLMRLGMKFFIDLKGKKKENMGIEFPVKSEQPANNTENGYKRNQTNGEQQGPDLKTIKKMLALNLLYMKVFGFEGESKPEDQGLVLPDRASLAFAWDSAKVMHIEYRIPLKLIDNLTALQQKTISIGWKISGRDINPEGSFNEGPGNRGGGRPGGNRPNQEEMEKIMKENNFWTKYTFR